MTHLSEIANDLLTTALEGGSNYWAQIETSIPKSEDPTRQCFSERVWDFIMSGGSVAVSDLEEGDDLGTFNNDSLVNAFKVMEETYPYHYKNAVNDEWDGITADVFFQCAVMGKIVFG
jgi:hypothetical protein